MPKLTAEIFGAPDGEVYPRTFAAGEECPPSLEDAARAAGALDLALSAKAKAGAPENKAK